MIKIEAKTIEDAYAQASQKLNCSIVDLNTNVIQYPSGGFLGMFGKNAIIEAGNKNDKRSYVKGSGPSSSNQQQGSYYIDPEKREDIKKVVKIVKKDFSNLLKTSAYDMKITDISVFDDETIYIAIDGEDTALVIGKEGSRYKALSYMLYNWVKLKYGYRVKLEISSFLKNQEENIAKYVDSIGERIKSDEKVFTKPLDGVLALIALEQLREKYPHKYVGLKTNRYGKKFIIIDEKRQ